MRVVRFYADGRTHVGFEHKDHFVPVTTLQDEQLSMRGLLAQLPARCGFYQEKLKHPQGTIYDRPQVKLCAPIADPRKIPCIGMNYRDHVTELHLQPPKLPIVFCKPPTAIIGPGDDIVLPPGCKKVDYEAEFVIVIGTGGSNIAEETALRHIAAYTCGHDVSERYWQLEDPGGGQWFLGKAFDTFAPIGPAFVTSDEIADPGNLAISGRLNGQRVQNSNTSNLIFSVPYIVAYLSRVMTLEPGDLIFTGTPGGVGHFRNPPVYLKPHDYFEVIIDGIGTLRNEVVSS